MGYVDKPTGWQTVIRSVAGTGNGQRNCSSIYWIWRFWTVSSCCHHMVRNCCIETFVSSLCETCWTMLQGVLLSPQRPMGRPIALSVTISRREEVYWCHWPTSSVKRKNCRVCSSRGKRRSILTKWKKCDVRLCILWCFEENHTKARFS
jgi:hypothetical protein